MDLSLITLFLCYSLGVNIALYIIMLITMVYFKRPLTSATLHLFRMSNKKSGFIEELALEYLARFETLVIFFNIVPLIALSFLA